MWRTSCWRLSGYDSRTAPAAGTPSWDLAFRLRRRGVTAPCVDTAIAAIAIAHSCVLFHLDEHFQLIAQHAELATKQALLR